MEYGVLAAHHICSLQRLNCSVRAKCVSTYLKKSIRQSTPSSLQIGTTSLKLSPVISSRRSDASLDGSVRQHIRHRRSVPCTISPHVLRPRGGLDRIAAFLNQISTFHPNLLIFAWQSAPSHHRRCRSRSRALPWRHKLLGGRTLRLQYTGLRAQSLPGQNLVQRSQ